MQTLATAEKSTSPSTVTHRSRPQPFFAPVNKQSFHAIGAAKAQAKPGHQQSNTGPIKNASVEPLPKRNDVELIVRQLRHSNEEFLYFLYTMRNDISYIRAYFKWVSDVYERTYGHYDLVLKQANEKADKDQKLSDLFAGFIVGVGVGLVSEYFAAAATAKYACKSLELLGNIGGELVEGGISAWDPMPKIATAKISDELNPAFKKIQSLEILDQLNSCALDLSISGMTVYVNPISLAKDLSAELRVNEANGPREKSDADIWSDFLKINGFANQDMFMQITLKEQQEQFNKLRGKFMGKQAPTDQRCEQDIWIPWLAQQDAMGAWGGILGGWGPFASIVLNKIILNHLVDIDLANRDKKGGRLYVNVNYHQIEDTGFLSDEQVIALKIIDSAWFEAKSLPAYWKDVFLMG